MTVAFQNDELFTSETLFTSAELLTLDAAFQQSAFGAVEVNPPGGPGGGGGGDNADLTSSLLARAAVGRQVTVTLVAGSNRRVMFDERV